MFLLHIGQSGADTVTYTLLNIISVSYTPYLGRGSHQGIIFPHESLWAKQWAGKTM